MNYNLNFYTLNFDYTDDFHVTFCIEIVIISSYTCYKVKINLKNSLIPPEEKSMETPYYVGGFIYLIKIMSIYINFSF